MYAQKFAELEINFRSAWDSDMNDQDKVLISTYLDNELTQEESTYFESLIENDDEALSYLNKLKEINNQTESFFQEALNSNEFKNFQSFVDDLKPKKKVSLKSILKNFFIPQAIAGYALSGLLFFNIGTNSVEGFHDIYPQVTHGDFQQDILVFRSGESDDFLNQVKNVAINLTKEGKQKAKGSYGDKDYTLQITKEATINAESKCFLAEFESINEQKLFSICKSGENSSILEVTQ